MFKPGQSGNIKGRPPKAINKVARPLKMRISEFLDQRFNELPGIWSKLPPKEKARLFVDLLPFIMPKMTNVDLDMNFSQLSEQDLDMIIAKMMTK
jgi:hypothetical protein